MDDEQTFAAIAEERRALADVLDGLDAAQWSTPSLCGEWDVRGVAAHLVAPTVTGIPEILWLVLRARGNFEKSNVALTDRVDALQDVAGDLWFWAEASEVTEKDGLDFVVDGVVTVVPLPGGGIGVPAVH